MSYSKLGPKELERIDTQLDEVKMMLGSLHTLTIELSPDDDDRFRTAEAVWWLAEKVARDAYVALDEITGLIGGVRSGRFDDAEAEEQKGGAA